MPTNGPCPAVTDLRWRRASQTENGRVLVALYALLPGRYRWGAGAVERAVGGRSRGAPADCLTAGGGRPQPPLKGRTSGFMLANRPDGFGYQSHTCSVTRSGCQNPNPAPVPGAVFEHAACDAAGTNVPST
jgi:hypothetical protein